MTKEYDWNKIKSGGASFEKSGAEKWSRAQVMLEGIDALNAEVLMIQKELLSLDEGAVGQEKYDQTIGQLKKRLNDAYIKMGEKIKESK